MCKSIIQKRLRYGYNDVKIKKKRDKTCNRKKYKEEETKGRSRRERAGEIVETLGRISKGTQPSSKKTPLRYIFLKHGNIEVDHHIQERTF